MAIRLRDIDPAVFLNNVAIGTTSASSHSGFRTLTLAGSTNGCMIDMFKDSTRMGYVATNGVTDFRVGSIANVPFYLVAGANAQIEIRHDGKVIAPNLPTTTPNIAGAIWRSGNDLKISTG